MGGLGVKAAELLQELRAAGAALRVVDGRLEAKRLPPPLAALARAHAAELRTLLAPPAPPDELQIVANDDEEGPEGFAHRYRPPPEHRALPPFRWSTLPPTTRRPAAPPTPAPSPPAGVIESPEEPRAGAVHGPRELPERRAARFGYRIDEFGSWLEPGEASCAPFRARFALGYQPSAAEQEAAIELRRRITADCAARLGPGAVPF